MRYKHPYKKDLASALVLTFCLILVVIALPFLLLGMAGYYGESICEWLQDLGFKVADWMKPPARASHKWLKRRHGVACLLLLGSLLLPSKLPADIIPGIVTTTDFSEGLHPSLIPDPVKLTVLWVNDQIRAARAEWDNTHPRTFEPGDLELTGKDLFHECFFKVGEAQYEFGLRSDGVVVWRPFQPPSWELIDDE